ncbi:MAG: hypothetical protein J5482_03850 [Oscillospiraceae bacterium]|nr:hypothetical protein [Oscillospiraceae bacterium]
MDGQWDIFKETGAPELYLLWLAQNRAGEQGEDTHAERKNGNLWTDPAGDGDEGNR